MTNTIEQRIEEIKQQMAALNSQAKSDRKDLRKKSLEDLQWIANSLSRTQSADRKQDCIDFIILVRYTYKLRQMEKNIAYLESKLG